MKRLTLFLLLGALALTATFWRASAQSGASSSSMSVPVITHGPDGVQRVIQNQQLGFSVSGASGADFDVFNESGSSLGRGAVRGLSTQGFSASTPNSTTTALSCTDRFWDINFVVRRSCSTIGDKVTIFLEQGSVRTPLITLVTQNGGLLLTQKVDAVSINDRSLTGSFVNLGDLIPFSAAGGTQTPLITFSVGQRLMGCGRLGAEIMRGSRVGSTSVIFADAVVIRNDNGKTANGPGINGNGTISSDSAKFGYYPTGRDSNCPMNCPSTCPPSKDKDDKYKDKDKDKDKDDKYKDKDKDDKYKDKDKDDKYKDKDKDDKYKDKDKDDKYKDKDKDDKYKDKDKDKDKNKCEDKDKDKDKYN